MSDDRTNALGSETQLEPALAELDGEAAAPTAPRRGRGRSAARQLAEPEPSLEPTEARAELEIEVAPELELETGPETTAVLEDASADQGEEGVAAEVSDAELEREIAALLFATAEPLSAARLSGLLGEVPRARIERAIEDLGRRLATSGLPYELRAVAGGWQLFTSPDLCETVSALARVRRDERVSPAALETLAVIAYRQPVSKAEIEAIRGVQAGPILRALVDRGLVRVAGRSTDPGHALLYGTTRQFLDVFGLASLDDLPRDGELLKD